MNLKNNELNNHVGILFQMGIEEAYQYYLKQSYRFHINTPCWFYSSLKFEISSREKTIEIFLDKQGYSTYLSNYYEMQFTRNRFLMKTPSHELSYKINNTQSNKKFYSHLDPIKIRKTIQSKELLQKPTNPIDFSETKKLLNHSFICSLPKKQIATLRSIQLNSDSVENRII